MASSTLSKSVKAYKTNSTTRRGSIRLFTDVGSLMTCTNEVPIKKKKDGQKSAITVQTAATYRGHDEESAGWAQTEMQHRLHVRDSISRYNAAFCLGKIKAAN